MAAQTPTQDGRLIGIETPLGKDKLLLSKVEVNEGVSRLFEIGAEVLSEDRGVKADQLVGKEVTIWMELADGGKRFFHGIVSRFSKGGNQLRFQSYRLEVVPSLWLLTKSASCRVFQDVTAPEVIEKVFQKLGITNIQYALKRTYTKRDYLVQYRESDLTFLSRLMESEGIFYFFQHEQKKHTLVISDDPQSHEPCPQNARAQYLPEAGPADEIDGINDWSSEVHLRPGKYSLRDYNFQLPDKTLDGTEKSTIDIGGNSKLEIYDFPGGYAQHFNKPDERLGDVEKEARQIVKLRMEAEETEHNQLIGTSTCRGFCSGFRFDRILRQSQTDADGPYVLTEVRHSATQSPEYASENHVRTPYHNSFRCIPHKVNFLPPQITPKPVMHGLHSAMVVGPAGEEIYTDKYGRVRIQFPWDRDGKKNESSSCWVRVAQVSAGKQWGAFFWPRIDHEVLVAFLHGDPDHPVVVGSVYNASNMPPYEMPRHQTRSGVMTRSSKDGDSQSFNELRFEDLKDEEEIYFHAERNFNRVVENNDTLKVGFAKKDKGDQTIEVFNNQSLTIGTAEASEGSQTTEIWKDRTTTLKTGNDKIVIELGKSTTEAMQSIELRVGQNSIVIDQMGIKIKGLMITIDGQLNTDVKGLMTNVQGTAMLVAKGGLTMIN